MPRAEANGQISWLDRQFEVSPVDDVPPCSNEAHGAAADAAATGIERGT